MALLTGVARDSSSVAASLLQCRPQCVRFGVLRPNLDRRIAQAILRIDLYKNISMIAAKILVFDSGMGGLTIFDHLVRRFPLADYVYVSDHAFAPYGQKPASMVHDRVLSVLGSFTHLEVDIVVLACNTASTIALEALRQAIAGPIVGVVPAIKPAAAMTRSGVVGLLATQSTSQGIYVANLIKEYASRITVIPCPSSALVSLAEAKAQGQEVDRTAISDALQPLLAHPLAGKMDIAVLGCTHFPLLHQEIRDHLGNQVTLIDSGDAIARRVHQLLGSHHQTAMSVVGSRGIGKRQAFVSWSGTLPERLLRPFRDRGFDSVDGYC